ncbi:PE-PGRS family protein [Streptomyces sp. DSM 41527]|uniref:PE-PGRS family protein n=1 Tax=Streptomyces mooreae TaxID=3075523 RepID=A0ABU2TAD2_9ACTN|nr:PE-PGRS family protein [Streptomyces sp. DSM 41527]MDT0457899.1 PE-PGRS family protein [Streptomyces sp. DSM 41527]
MDAGQVLRGLRAAVFAVVCVLLAALGHMVMSDAVVPAWMLLAAGVGTAAGAWCCAGRERGPLLVALLTVGTQAALHSAFSLGQAVAGSGGGESSLARRWAETWLCGADGTRLSGHGSSRLIQLMHQQLAALPSTDRASRLRDMAGTGHTQHMGHMGFMGDMGSMDAMSGMAHAGQMPGMHGSATGMLAAHLLVALLSAGWLWGGERAAFQLVRSLSAWLFAPLVLVLRILLPDPRPAVRAARQEPRRAVRQLLLAHTRSLRGPPQEPAVG